MIITAEIEKLANLARIKIDESEKKGLTKEIDSILNYIDEIKKASIDLDLNNKAETGNIYNIFRDDI